MPVVPLIASHDPIEILTVSGGPVELDNPTLAFSTVGVDYGNKGDDTEPPTLSYINEVDDTETNDPGNLGNKVGILLPLSAEGVSVPSGEGFIQYRHPRWSRY